MVLMIYKFFAPRSISKSSTLKWPYYFVQFHVLVPISWSKCRCKAQYHLASIKSWSSLVTAQVELSLASHFFPVEPVNLLTVPNAPFPRTFPFFHCIVSSNADVELRFVHALSALSSIYMSESMEPALMAFASSSRCRLGRLSSSWSISTNGLLLISAARFCTRNKTQFDLKRPIYPTFHQG